MIKKYLRRFWKKEEALEKEISKELVAEEKRLVKFWKKGSGKVIVISGVVILFLLSIVAARYLCWKKVVLPAGTNLKLGFIGDFEYGYKNKIGNKPTKKAPEALVSPGA